MPTEPTFTCATCDVEIRHHPVFHLGHAFCCAGCAAGGPCMCSYDAVDPTPEAASAERRARRAADEAGRVPAAAGVSAAELGAARRG